MLKDKINQHLDQAAHNHNSFFLELIESLSQFTQNERFLLYAESNKVDLVLRVHFDFETETWQREVVVATFRNRVGGVTLSTPEGEEAVIDATYDGQDYLISVLGDRFVELGVRKV